MHSEAVPICCSTTPAPAPKPSLRNSPAPRLTRCVRSMYRPSLLLSSLPSTQPLPLVMPTRYSPRGVESITGAPAGGGVCVSTRA